MRITRILHASVNTSAATEETAAFYRDVLGLATTWRPDIGVPGTWFTVDDAQLHLVGSAPLPGVLDPRAHHVCFGTADLDAAVAELDARDVPYVSAEQQHPGRVVRQVFFTDPAGNVIELQEDPS